MFFKSLDSEFRIVGECLGLGERLSPIHGQVDKLIRGKFTSSCVS